ncbi:MAG: acetyl-CoA carboxylase biotin carboxylase subunit [Myxococcales bacterium]|nr:acetyl-CoA carboxylase biotin carboxylase subunit [Myxococcales bacterium]
MTRLSKVLVANRGEIAARVIRTCRKLGIRTVAVYSDADRGAPHVLAADEAVHLGASPARESYLVAEKLLAAARATGADAVHPGYGFLSENDQFSSACAEAGIVFVGPRPEAVRLMGNKRQAKLRMLAAGVPCIPGYEGADQSDETLAQEALRIGLPVMVKAAAGGGGRGMRLVTAPEALAEAIRSARSEAENAFGSGELILEKAVVNARHVEIQVFADSHGNVVHLGERDCSVQRRHQKIIEECPSPAVTPALREAMGEVAVAAARAIDYLGAGTIEFLLAPTGEFYFMEMNTRLQVEHPVTELVTGTDLVAWQLAVAAGEPLPKSQAEIDWRGHAIEVRLCAEDPAREFMPQTGRIVALELPEGEGVRVDHGLAEGRDVSPFYDSMVGKLIAHGATREEARCRLVAALERLALLGVVTNKELLLHGLRHPAFASGEYDTGFVPAHLPSATLAGLGAPTARQVAVAGAALFHADADALRRTSGLPSELVGWSSSHAPSVPVKISCGGEERVVVVRPIGRSSYEVELGDLTLTLEVEGEGEGGLREGARLLRFTAGGTTATARVARDGATTWIDWGASVHAFTDVSLAPRRAEGRATDGRVLAPIDGKVLRVEVAVGDVVKKGQLLVVLEAMKMEFQLAAEIDGTVATLSVAPGAQVSARHLLVEVAPAG